MSGIISQASQQIIDKVVNEVKKEENQDKIKYNVIDPCVDYIVNRLYPYMVITGIIFILTFLMALIILLIMVKKNM